jgi:hypothetical protein
LHQQTTAEQRSRASERLRSWEADFRLLATAKP